MYFRSMTAETINSKTDLIINAFKYLEIDNLHRFPGGVIPPNKMNRRVIARKRIHGEEVPPEDIFQSQVQVQPFFSRVHATL